MFKIITREELKAKLDAKEPMKLVFVLEPSYFEKIHLPGSINIDVDEMEEKAPEILDKNEQIIVYCANFSCQASPNAAKKLIDIGYTDVTDYEGGLQDWQEAGYPLEGSKA